MHLQRLQRADTKLRRDETSKERQDRCAALADTRDPADAAGEKPPGQDGFRLVDEDGVHRPEQETDAADGDGVFDEGRHDPDRHFQPDECQSEAHSVLSGDALDSEEGVYEEGSAFANLRTGASARISLLQCRSCSPCGSAKAEGPFPTSSLARQVSDYSFPM